MFKDSLLHSSALSSGPMHQAARLPRQAYRCAVTNQEIADMGPNPTWAEWRALFLSKEIPPMRLVEGADFRLKEKGARGIVVEFP